MGKVPDYYSTQELLLTAGVKSTLAKCMKRREAGEAVSRLLLLKPGGKAAGCSLKLLLLCHCRAALLSPAQEFSKLNSITLTIEKFSIN